MACGTNRIFRLPAKPPQAVPAPRPTLNCVHEDSMLSSDLLSSSDEEGEEPLGRRKRGVSGFVGCVLLGLSLSCLS